LINDVDSGPREHQPRWHLTHGPLQFDPWAMRTQDQLLPPPATRRGSVGHPNYDVAVGDQLPHRRASSFAVVMLTLLGVALMLAAFRVDAALLSGGRPATWHGLVHAIAFLLIIATGVLAPLTMAVAVRGDPSWRPVAVVSIAASALFIVFLILPWGKATFLLAIVTLFGWIAAVAARLATHHP